MSIIHQVTFGPFPRLIKKKVRFKDVMQMESTCVSCDRLLTLLRIFIFNLLFNLLIRYQLEEGVLKNLIAIKNA